MPKYFCGPINNDRTFIMWAGVKGYKFEDKFEDKRFILDIFLGIVVVNQSELSLCLFAVT